MFFSHCYFMATTTGNQTVLCLHAACNYCTVRGASCTNFSWLQPQMRVEMNAIRNQHGDRGLPFETGLALFVKTEKIDSHLQKKHGFFPQKFHGSQISSKLLRRNLSIFRLNKNRVRVTFSGGGCTKTNHARIRKKNPTHH